MLFSKHIIACFFWLIVVLHAVANNNQLQTYIGLNYHSQVKKGYFSAFAFHDHDPRFGNNNFHVHNYCNPFVKGKEVLQFVSLSGQYVVNEKMALAVKLPYSLKTQIFKDSINLFRQGIGDIALGFKYVLFKSKGEQLFAKTKHQTIFSIYTQLKTGNYNEATALNDIDPHIQNGAGTTNWLASFLHFIDIDSWSFNGAVNYQLNTKNYYQFKKGNAFEALVSGAYNFNFDKEWLFIPAINLSYQKKIADTMEDKMILKPTAYKAFSAGTDLQLQYKNFIFNLSYSMPVYLGYEERDGQCIAPEKHQRFGLELRWLMN